MEAMLEGLSQKSTADLKRELLARVEGRDGEALSKKVQFYKTDLLPWFEELSRRNPFPQVEDQVRLVVGSWMPVWSTIPFQDIFPGRLYDQSYQIFLDNGYYANLARYAPGSKLPILRKLTSKLLAYDFMILQKYEVQRSLTGLCPTRGAELCSTSQWYIQNVGIQQAFRFNVSPLTLEKAKAWMAKAVQARLQSAQEAEPETLNLENLDKSTARKYEKIFQATPQLEHLYIDADFRLVKTQREAKQRSSYTIAVRKS